MLQNLFKRKNKPVKRDGLVYLFSYGNHHFYTFERIEVTVARRYLAYTRLVRMHELGVSREDLKAFTELIRAANNKGDRSTVGAACEALEAFTDLYTDNKRTFEIANCFVLIDDEPVERFSEAHTFLKHQLFEGSAEVRFFFVKSALEYLRKISELPPDLKLEDYLNSKEVRLTEKVFSRLITKSSSAT